MVVEISATLFQPARSGSHLYSAPLHPVRSRTLSSRSYSPLVGLATPLLPCFPHLHPYYITRMGICQEVFLGSLEFFLSSSFVDQRERKVHTFGTRDTQTLVQGGGHISLPS